MPQMSPDAHQTAAEAEQDAEHDDQYHVLGTEEDEPCQSPAALVPEQQVARVTQYQRQEPTEQPLQGAFEQKRAADEPVGSADQAHDRDLPGSLEDRESDRDPNDDHRHGSERHTDDQSDQTG